MTRTLTALIATLAVAATLAIDVTPAQAAGAEASSTRGFLSSGHTTGSNIVRGPIAGGDLGSGR